jgi:predicted ATPase/DNA-binding XRE family transcriptional regulator
MAREPGSSTRCGFGELLRRYRVDAGLTQEALAERAGLSARGLSDLERGLRRRPRTDTVQRLVAALGLRGADRARLEGTTPVDRAETNGFGELPIQLTSFVGREAEVATVRRLLGTSRLVTLTGPGGIGKTRLALQVGQQEVGRRQVVQLAPVTDQALVPQTVAVCLRVREQPGIPVLRSLIAALGDASLLLILDNCEHLLAACRELIDTLLRACPRLRILTTSRSVIGMAGETIWSVPGLQLPDGSAAYGGGIDSSEAVTLFLQRAQSARPGFVLDRCSAPAVSAICRAVDGLPLAIELAAARLRVLTVDQIDERLQRALYLLVHGPSTDAPRHETLRSTFDWSYDLLGDPERRVFERMSVFRGGWTIDAAEQVCNGAELDQGGVFELLSHLVDHSLVVAEPGQDGAMRFRLLEPLRQYAAERLDQRGEVEDTDRRHTVYYTGLVEALGYRWLGGDLPRLKRMDVERDNARTALRRAIDHGDAEAALGLAGAMGYYWQQRGYANEGRAWLSESLALPTVSDTVRKARALVSASTLVSEQGDYAAADPLIEEALTIARQLGDGATLAFALFRAAQLTWFRRKFAAARDLAEEGVGLGRALNLRNLEGINLWQCAQAAHDLGDPRAQALAEQTVAHFTDLENPTMLGCALTTLAQVHLGRGQLDTARRLLDQAVATHPREFQGVAQMFSSVSLGWVATDQGDLAAAHTALLLALRIARDALGARARLVTPLEGLAQLAAAADQPRRAIHLAGAAARLRRDYGTPPTPTETRQLTRWLACARARLDRSDAETAWAEGERLTPEAAIALALERDRDDRRERRNGLNGSLPTRRVTARIDR